MNDLFEIIDDLKEMQALYNTGDLRDYDFESKIQKYNGTVDMFEKEYEMDDGA